MTTLVTIPIWKKLKIIEAHQRVIVPAAITRMSRKVLIVQSANSSARSQLADVDLSGFVLDLNPNKKRQIQAEYSAAYSEVNPQSEKMSNSVLRITPVSRSRAAYSDNSSPSYMLLSDAETVAPPAPIYESPEDSPRPVKNQSIFVYIGVVLLLGLCGPTALNILIRIGRVSTEYLYYLLYTDTMYLNASSWDKTAVATVAVATVYGLYYILATVLCIVGNYAEQIIWGRRVSLLGGTTSMEPNIPAFDSSDEAVWHLWTTFSRTFGLGALFTNFAWVVHKTCRFMCLGVLIINAALMLNALIFSVWGMNDTLLPSAASPVLSTIIQMYKAYTTSYFIPVTQVPPPVAAVPPNPVFFKDLYE